MKQNFPLISLIFCTIVLALVWLPLPFKIRFETQVINYLFLGAVYAVFPLFIGLSAAKLNRRAWRIFGVIVAVVFAIPCLFISTIVFLSTADFKNGQDPSFEKLSEITKGQYTYRLYLSNCGAICDFGLVLQREFDTPLGLKVIWPEWSQYPAEPSGSLRLVEHQLQVLQNGGVIGAVRT